MKYNKERGSMECGFCGKLDRLAPDFSNAFMECGCPESSRLLGSGVSPTRSQWLDMQTRLPPGLTAVQDAIEVLRDIFPHAAIGANECEEGVELRFRYEGQRLVYTFSILDLRRVGIEDYLTSNVVRKITNEVMDNALTKQKKGAL